MREALGNRAMRGAMAGRENSKKEAEGTVTSVNKIFSVDMKEENVEELEREASALVSRAISQLEKVIAAWEASKDKPKDLEPKINRYIWFRNELANWETSLLKSKKKNLKPYERMAMIMKLVRICDIYQQSGVKG